MNQETLRGAEKFTKAHRQKKRWYRVVTCLAAVVVFCTTYALILPAITMEGEVCGLQEHTHNVECYTQVTSVSVKEPVCTMERLNLHRHTGACYDENGRLICGYADFVIHTHDSSCYTEDGVLWCPLPEIRTHVHDDSCYWVPEAEGPEAHVHMDECYILEQGQLLCEIPEFQGHTHGEDCFTTTVTLVCGIPESEGHFHGEGCYDENGELICELEESEGHIHGDDCYERSTELTCTLPEEIGHQHTDECYEWNRVLTCTLSTEPVETEAPQPELVCGRQEIVLHRHSESCFDEYGNVICGKLQILEHVHTEDCFETIEKPVDTEVLTCPLEEGEGAHTHGEGCYDENGHLICGLVESAGHRHSTLCYGTWELTCGLPEHIHTEACLPEEEPETAYFCGKEAHTHDETCYDEAGTLTCTLEEHIHTLACLSDPNADVEMAQDWERTFADVRLTGNWPVDVIQIARTQLGYRESTRNYIVSQNGDIKGYTRYGAWYGDPYEDWCAMFVAFCMHYAQVEQIIFDPGCQTWIDAFRSRELYAAAEDYIPTPGDVIFFDNNVDGTSDHVGLVEEVTDTAVITIEGNDGDAVVRREYAIGEPVIFGYGILPDGPTQLITKTATIYTDGTYRELAEDPTVITLTCYLPEGAEAVAFPVTVETGMRALCAYDISVRLPEDALLAPPEDAPVTITIQSPDFSGLEEGTDTMVYWVPETGEPEIVESERTDDQVRFEVSRLHVYMVTAADLAEEKPAAIALSDDFLYENEEFSILLHVEGSARLMDETPEAEEELTPELTDAEGEFAQQLSQAPEDGAAAEPLPEAGDELASDEPAEAEKTAQKPVLVVTELDAGQSEYQQFAATLEEGYPEGVLNLSVLSMAFTYQDTLLDVSSCSITAQVTPRTRMMETAQAACAELEADAAPEAETGVVFAVVEATEDGTEELDSAMVGTSTREAPVLTASVDSSGILAVAAAQTANPKFTVQYYAWLDAVADSGSETDNLPVIDTSGGVLPQNGITPTTKTLYLEETASGSGIYGIKTTRTLTQVYTDHEYQYITAPNLTYFNRLYENGHYSIKEIWILKDGKDVESVDKEDWDVYDPAVTHFTNRSQSVKDNTILITDRTVIRLVFETTESIYTNSVNFYDYDITNDGVHTNAQGINSVSNYTGSGAKLAFGNNNTDTGLAGETWNGNTLNKANSNGYSDCTFGLVTGLGGGKIQYAGGVSSPNLFDDGTATGKTSYDNGQYTLSFDRSGDTYTLSSVGGTSSATSLQTFTGRWNWNKTRMIWSNHFWPMDNVTNTDPHTGTPGNTGTYIGASGETRSYPESDNGIAHNNMFGMTYKVQFTLTEDYTGPLEYYFFGDDDMWVFLDGRLVCDIGGVHSSVGEYVNLWDYVTKGSAGTHTLSFFYTERGLSGSTCYMQFTLPSVSSITPEQNTGLLTVQKLVEGAVDSDEEFRFEIMFTDASGNPLPDDYSYTRYTVDGTIVKQDVIIYDGGSFELKAGEYVIINYLPYGTRYTITEMDVPYYTVTYQVDGGAPTEGYTAVGRIPTGGNGSVVFTNTAMPVLPSTGGAGTYLYTTVGVLLMTAAVLLLCKNKKRRKEDIASS